MSNILQKLLFLVFVSAMCLGVAGFVPTDSLQVKNSIYFGQGLTILEQQRDRFVYKELLSTQELVINEGEFLAQKLRIADIEGEQQVMIIKKLNPVFPVSKIQPGQKIILLRTSAETKSLVAIKIPVDVKSYWLLEAETGFNPEKREKSLVSKVKHVDGIINTTFSEAASEFDVPDDIYHAYLGLMSFDISFQLDIRAGTQFAILYEELYNNEGELVDYGDIWLARLTLPDNREFVYYRYENQEGDTDYYSRDGKTARKLLLKSPINTRISSPYGLRRHPILGYTKLHRGVDFAAAQGTFIYAAGDGKVLARGFNANGYGRYIMLQHKQGYVTLYGHMYGFGRNKRDGDRRIREGRTVKQGDVIGRVGSTGRSTGPHLHFEIRRYDKHLNPLRVKFKPSQSLSGTEYDRFLQGSLYLDHISKVQDETDAYGFKLSEWLLYRKSIAAIRANNL